MADEREQEQTEQHEEDLEVSEEQADEVEGGGARWHAPEDQPFKRGAPDPQAKR